MTLSAIPDRRTHRSPILAAALASISLSACGTVATIHNDEPVAAGAGYQTQYRAENDQRGVKVPFSPSGAACAVDTDASLILASATVPAQEVEQLSSGDLVEVKIGDDDVLSGAFKVSQDGVLRLPHLPPVQAQGKTVDEVEAAIADQLLRGGLYLTTPTISVRITDTAGARVFVSGAVFEPGAVTVGAVDARAIDTARQHALGWDPDERRLSRAVQSAGGIRPDADLANVMVRRGASQWRVDMRPAMVGQPFSDTVLQAGDRIEIPSRGCFQTTLMRPSAITAPGIRVYMSNLTQPAAGNAVSAIGKETQELPYGTRLMQAVVGMNCVGGARYTNADRSVVLMTHNPITGASIVVSRRIEDLIGRADRDNYNPYILPGDAMACYDSRQTNILAVTNALGSVASTALLASKL